MNGVPLQETFSWYDTRERRALPPKSLFVLLFTLVLLVTVPATGFWFLEHYPALQWMSTVAAVLLACLMVDATLTYQRYKNWSGEWLCGDCKGVFAPEMARRALER